MNTFRIESFQRWIPSKVNPLSFYCLKGFLSEEIPCLKEFKYEGIQFWRDSILKGINYEEIQLWRDSILKEFLSEGIQLRRDLILKGFNPEGIWVRTISFPKEFTAEGTYSIPKMFPFEGIQTERIHSDSLKKCTIETPTKLRLKAT